MLSKKIHRLKKKIKKYSSSIHVIENLIEDNLTFKTQITKLDSQIKNQNDKIQELEKELKVLEVSDALTKNKINIMCTSIELLEKYKDTCSKDIPVLASAITEIYNILNVIVDATTSQNRTSVIIEDPFLVEDYYDTDKKKKKKKIYH